MVYFIFSYFSMELCTSVDWHEKILTESFIEIVQEINGTGPIIIIVLHMYWKTWFYTLENLLSRKACAQLKNSHRSEN
jgi:hypothetical protein